MLNNRPLPLLLLALGVSFLLHISCLVLFRPTVRAGFRYYHISYWGSFLSPAEISRRQISCSPPGKSPPPQKPEEALPGFLRQLRRPRFSSPFSFYARGGGEKKAGLGGDIYIHRTFSVKLHEEEAEFSRAKLFLASPRRFSPVVYVSSGNALPADAGEKNNFLGGCALRGGGGGGNNVRLLVSPEGKVMFAVVGGNPQNLYREFSLYYWLQGLFFEKRKKKEWVDLDITRCHD